MAGEKAVDAKALTPTQRNAEAIISRLTEYISVRFDHAIRINPEFRSIKHDLIYHEMANVRRALTGDKIYGPSRQSVADVFLGDDEKRRRGLMSPNDQTSIQVELVSHCQDERLESTRGQIRFHDLKTFYAAIDRNLSDMMDLIETWIWWDILDAAELVRFEQKLGVISLCTQGRMGPELRKRYTTLIHATTEEGAEGAAVASDEDIIKYEFKQLQFLREQWVHRRSSERGFMFILKRDELPHESQGEMIHRVAALVREYDAVEAMEPLEPQTSLRYQAELRMSEEEITKEHILSAIHDQLLSLEREMIHRSEEDSRLGPPYNYKQRQLEQMDKWLGDLAQQLKAVLAKPSAAQPEK